MTEETGECYKNTLLWAIENSHLADHMMICHGFPKYHGEGEGDAYHGYRMYHAWLELTPVDPVKQRIVVDVAGTMVAMLKKEYYSHGELNDSLVTRYTHAEAISEALRFNHWGPWDEDYPPIPES